MSLIALPPWRVSYFEINNTTNEATLENQYRATLAQVLGGVAIGIGLYYTWRRITIAEEDLKATKENLKVSQESQITERFTRAIDQLGNPNLEIRLGGIYALERISKESYQDYLPIIEILTAYIRMNSSDDSILKENSLTSGNISMDIQSNESTKHNVSKVRKVSPDIQAIFTVLGRRINNGEPNILDLQATCLEGANLDGAYLEKALLRYAHLERSNLGDAHFEEADFTEAHFEGFDLSEAHFEGADLSEAHFEGACLIDAHLSAHMKTTDLYRAHFEGADIYQTHLEGADLKDVHLEGAELIGTHLEGAKNLTIDQLSKVKTLYKAEIDNVLLIPLKKNYPSCLKTILNSTIG